jgi:hypothetical protein
MGKILLAVATLLIAGYAYGQNPWLGVDTLTRGNFDDLNPQVDHAGLGMINVGLSVGPLAKEWVVFERWENGASSIAALEFNANLTSWDTSVSIVSPAKAGTVQKYPDICTNLNSVSACAWQGMTGSTWNIYCSQCSINDGNWSTPIAVTNDSVSNTNVKVRALSDSSFLLIWRRGQSILYSILQNDQVSTPQTLVATNCDSTEYDFAVDYMPSQSELVWTKLDTSGNRICLLSKVTNLTSLSLSSPDTIGCDGDMSNPRFMCYSTSFVLSFNLRQRGIEEVWQTSYSGPSGVGTPEELAGDMTSNYSDAVFFVPPLMTGISKQLMKHAQLDVSGICAWQKQTAGDTSIVFVGSTSDSTESGSNPSISPLSFFIGDKKSEGFIVWESDRTGRYHIYSRGYYWEQTAVSESTPPASDYRLEQNYPNPLNPSTVISYQLPVNSFVTLKIYDVLGREIQTLINERQNLGSHSVTFDASNLSSGVYFYRLQAGTYSETKKLMLLK